MLRASGASRRSPDSIPLLGSTLMGSIKYKMTLAGRNAFNHWEDIPPAICRGRTFYNLMDTRFEIRSTLREQIVPLFRKSAKSQDSSPATLEAVPATDSVKSVSGSQMKIGESVVTNRAKAILRATDEGMAWQESPSLVLLIPRLFKYAVIMAVLALACLWFNTRIHEMAVNNAPKNNTVAFSSPKPTLKHAKKGSHTQADQAQSTTPGGQAESPSVHSSDPAQRQSDDGPMERVALADRIMIEGLLSVAGLLLLKLVFYALRLKSTHYSSSSQRLFVEEGTFHTVNRSYELHHLGNAVLVKPFLIRPFGVANLAIGIPPVVLYGLRNASAVRDLLRTGGQLEAQRVDKIRWR